MLKNRVLVRVESGQFGFARIPVVDVMEVCMKETARMVLGALMLMNM